MTRAQLAHLKALERAATPGPWCPTALRVLLRYARKQSGPWDRYEHGCTVDGKDDCPFERPLPSEEEADAAFIASARNALPQLIAEVERLRAGIRQHDARCSRDIKDDDWRALVARCEGEVGE